MLYLRIRAPGSRATQAISSSFNTTLQENKSSREEIVDSIDPVWTQMKLYGIRPMKTAMKKRVTGIFSIGEVMFKNQLGLMGKNLRNNRKKNKLLLFSSTFFCSMATLPGKSLTMCCLPNAWDRRKQSVAPTVVRTQARRRPYHVPNKAPAKMFCGRQKNCCKIKGARYT